MKFKSHLFSLVRTRTNTHASRASLTPRHQLSLLPHLGQQILQQALKEEIIGRLLQGGRGYELTIVVGEVDLDGGEGWFVRESKIDWFCKLCASAFMLACTSAWARSHMACIICGCALVGVGVNVVWVWVCSFGWGSRG